MRIKPFTRNENKKFWEKEAIRKKDDPVGTHSDPYIVELENNFVLESLKNSKNILDIGCGNGQRTIMFAKKTGAKIKGIDYSENMINNANKILKKQSKGIRSRVKFEVYDAQNLKDAKFDAVISCRCIINQVSKSAQVDLFKLVHKHLKKGGSFIIAEGSLQGYQSLNQSRKRIGLKPIDISWYNLPIDEKYVFGKIGKLFNIKKLSRLGTYYLLTRVFYPASIYPKKPNPLSKNNQIAFMMEPLDDQNNFGAHLLVHFIKK